LSVGIPSRIRKRHAQEMCKEGGEEFDIVDIVDIVDGGEGWTGGKSSGRESF
jgi:hypothetical protein